MIEIIKTIISDFHHSQLPGPITKRELSIPIDSKKIISIIGPRRSGKTWFLYSLINDLKQEIDPRKIVYINFEDERIELSKSQLQLVLDAYQQLYPSIPISEVYFFFDEIQEVAGWEKFIRRLHESVSFKIFITGSSSKLLGAEISSSLRGRALSYVLLPFSFYEFLCYHNVSPENINSSSDRNYIISLFNIYLNRGGYPEVFNYENLLFIKTIQSYVDIMIFRDIIERHDVKKVHIVKDLMKRLIATNSKIFSINKYYNSVKSQGFHVSKDSIYEFMEYFEDAFAVIPLLKYHDSLIKQEKAMKKIYVNDTGIAAAFNFSIDNNSGWLLETFVFLEMKKKNMNVFYNSNGFETDFLVYDNNKISQVIQVCYTLNDENRTREIEGLKKAMDRFSLKSGYIITANQEDVLNFDGCEIHVIPGWKWSLMR